MSNTVGNAGYLNSIGVCSFGTSADSDEQNVVTRRLLAVARRGRDLEVGNLRDEDLGSEWEAGKVGEVGKMVVLENAVAAIVEELWVFTLHC